MGSEVPHQHGQCSKTMNVNELQRQKKLNQPPQSLHICLHHLADACACESSPRSAAWIRLNGCENQNQWQDLKKGEKNIQKKNKNKVPVVPSGSGRFLARNVNFIFHIKTWWKHGLNFLIEMHSVRKVVMKILYEKSKCLIYTCHVALCGFVPLVFNVWNIFLSSNMYKQQKGGKR